MVQGRKTSTEVARKKASAPERLASLKGKETTTMAAAAAVPEDKHLTEKQRAFALARAAGETVPNAMAIAGYNEQPSYGYRLDKMPNVRALIRQEQALYAEAAQVSRKDVIDMQMQAFEMAKLMSEPASMVSAAREIGKICGHYETKINVHHTGNIQHEIHRFETMTDEELIAVLASTAEQINTNESADALEHHDDDQ